MQSKKWQQGFLLLDVLVATLLLATALLAAGGLFVQATRIYARAADYTTATALAQEQLEKGKNGLTHSSPAAMTVTLNGREYWLEREKTAAGIPDLPHLSVMTVSVSWPAGGRIEKVQLTTYVIENKNLFPE